MRKTIPALLLLSSTALAQIDPVDAVDINPDPNIVEVNIVAAETTWEFIPGVPTTVYSYNGTIPGPTIRADVFDTVIVHFTNNLPEPTTIHWHGIELDASQDGSHISQVVVQPGESFDYQFVVRTDSLYWYHPHVRTFDQVEKGLYGALLVRNTGVEQALGLDQIEEHIIIFDDVLLDANNEIVPAFSFTDPLEHALYQLNGREGNVLLLNGKEASTQSLTVPNGEPLRFRVVNAANTTFGRLDINDVDDGWTSQLWEIGSDGGRVEAPFPRLPVTLTGAGVEHPDQALLSEMGEGIFVMPGERLDVVFTPIGNDGETFTIYQNDWFRGRHVAFFNGGMIGLGDDPMDGLYPKQGFLDITVTGPDPGTGEYVPPTLLRDIPTPIGDPRGVIPVTFGHGLPDPTTGNVTLFAQADFSTGTMVPLPAPKIDSFNAFDTEIGDIWIWEVTNLTHGDHPFHVHGFFFELLEYEFRDMDDPTLNFNFEPQRRIMKDTIRVPARLGAKGRSSTIARLRVLLDPAGRDVVAHGTTPTFDRDGNYISGGWLFHCHVLEHSGKGMLSFYEVRDPNDPFHLLGKELPGSLGKVSLTARGDLSTGTPVELDIVNAKANTQVIAIIGDGLGNLPYGGGVVIPNFTAFVNGSTDGNGAATLSYLDWESFPSGTELYVQVAVLDPLGYIPYFDNTGPASEDTPPSPLASPTGSYGNIRKGDIALSNALKFIVP